ncbi:MAG: phage portal protein [Dehalococcoidia bacterium]|nr:phage portal protein [Dehalococcoidia bacterium]
MPGLISRMVGAPRNAEITQITTSGDLAERLRRGEKTWAGLDLSVQRALTVGPVFAAVRVIAEDIGKLPFVVYRRDDDGPKERARDSDYWRLIHDAPNTFMTSQQFREYMTAQAMLLGNAYALKTRVGGQVRELLPLLPGQVRVEQLPDFELVYHVTMADGKVERKSRREVFHLRGYSLDIAGGAGIFKYARQTIAHTLAVEQFGATYFGNGAKPSAVFKHPATLSDEAYERLKTDLRSDFSGANANETMLLEEGLDFAPTSLSNEDSQFNDTRIFLVEECARWARVAPHKISHLYRSTFSNIEHQAIEHVTDTLMPWAQRWEDAFNLGVIREDGLYAELLFDALLRGDTKSQYEALRMATGRPWLKGDEARRALNLEPLGGDMDSVVMPNNAGNEGGNPRSEERVS